MPFATRGAPALALVLLVGHCACCFQPCFTSPPPLDPIEVGSLQVVPAVTHAEAGASFELEAVARDPGGHVIVDPFLQVKWTSGTGLDVGSGVGNPIVVEAGDWSALGATGPTFEVTDVVATAGGVASPPATILVTDPNHSGADRLVLSHEPDSAPAVALLDAHVGSAFKEDLMVAVAGRALLPDDLEEGSADPAGPHGTAPEIAVFSPYGSAFVVDRATLPTGGGVPWKSGTGDLFEPVIAPRAPIRVVLLQAAHRPFDVMRLMREHLMLAEHLLQRSRAGLRFEEADDDALGGDLGVFTTPPDCGEEEGPGTTATDPESTGGTSPCFPWSRETIHAEFDDLQVAVQDEEVIYIVYADRIAGGNLGWTFPAGDGSTPSFALVTVDVDTPSPTILAHELVHALGLNSGCCWGSGHAPADVGFDCSNLMWELIAVECVGKQDRLAIGQVFRINVDERSWLARTGRNPPHRKCAWDGRSWVGGTVGFPCPCLATDPVLDAAGGALCGKTLVGGVP